MDCKIRYAILNSNDILNFCGPAFNKYFPTGSSTLAIQLKNEAERSYIKEMFPFYENLEQSILSIGVKNPIVIFAGWCPPDRYSYIPLETIRNKKPLLVCTSLGGSRLWVAQKHNLTIPCIINDFRNIFKNEQILNNLDEILEYFQNKPKNPAITEHGFVALSV